MSTAYKPVGWNRNKLIYDAVLICGVVVYILLYLKLAPLLSSSVRAVDMPILRMRAFGSLAFLLLTIVLAIGPLARLDPRFLPLLYNRRHFCEMVDKEIIKKRTGESRFFLSMIVTSIIPLK